MTACTCNSFSSNTSTPGLVVTNTNTGDGLQCSTTNGSKTACWADNSYGGYGVVGSASGSTASVGVWGICHNANVGFGVKGSADGGGTGVLGLAGAGGLGGKFAALTVYDPGNSAITSLSYPGGCALYVTGDIFCTGFAGKGGGGWVLDHPADPENYYLNHAFVESDHAKNMYDGEVTFDANGEAKVVFEDWFPHVSDKPRMTVTARGKSMPGLYWDQVDDCTFKIGGGAPNGNASWILNCHRADPWQKKNGRPVVVAKTHSKGTYIHPELYGKGNDHREHKIPDANDPGMELKRTDNSEGVK